MSYTEIMLLFAKAAVYRNNPNALQIIQVCLCITSRDSVCVSDTHTPGSLWCPSFLWHEPRSKSKLLKTCWSFSDITSWPEGRATAEDHLGLTDPWSCGCKQGLKGVCPAAVELGSGRRPVTSATDPFYHNQKTLLLSQRSTAADYAGDDHDGASGDQDVSGGRVEAGGQQTDVFTLFHQGPHSHRQNNPSCQLRSKLNSNQMHITFLGVIYTSLLQFCYLGLSDLLHLGRKCCNFNILKLTFQIHIHRCLPHFLL